MPRERIQHPKYLPALSSHGKPGPVTEAVPALDIEWQRDMALVQLSIEFPREVWIGQAKDLAEQPNIHERAIYTGNLDRREINNLIRHLKRARDAAYGADE